MIVAIHKEDLARPRQFSHRAPKSATYIPSFSIQKGLTLDDDARRRGYPIAVLRCEVEVIQ